MKRIWLLPVMVFLLAACGREAGRGPLGSPATDTAPQTPAACLEPGPSEIVLCLLAKDQRPQALLYVGDERVNGVPGSSCWTTANGSEGVGACVDTVWPPEIDRFVDIDGDTAIVIAGDAGDVELSLAEPKSGDSLEKVDLEAGRGRLSIESGKYLLSVFATWPQGDASFAFGVGVGGATLESGG